MAIERRPTRPPTGPIPAAKPFDSAQGKPTTRVPPPSSKKPPTTRLPQRPATRSIPTEGRATGRGIPVAGKKSNTPLIVGGAAGGALLLIIIIAVAASGSKPSPDASKSGKKKGPAVVDVSELERKGMAKCDEGVTVIQRSYSVSDKAGLQRGIQLITEGNQLLDEAYQRSGNRYDTKKYNETLKMARGKVLELK